mmetsp:Transcript_4842/g.5368  ORF Transcript_4842/g.5368 Transcript_4842/m.5368 type:complete len:105 (-) Transcript_4842:78-392(-)
MGLKKIGIQRNWDSKKLGLKKLGLKNLGLKKCGVQKIWGLEAGETKREISKINFLPLFSFVTCGMHAHTCSYKWTGTGNTKKRYSFWFLPLPFFLLNDGNTIVL